MIETTITIKVSNTKEQFQHKDFQEFLRAIRSGVLQRTMKEDKVATDVQASYQTNYKEQLNQK